jgi:hypothetical protein
MSSWIGAAADTGRVDELPEPLSIRRGWCDRSFFSAKIDPEQSVTSTGKTATALACEFETLLGADR